MLSFIGYVSQSKSLTDFVQSQKLIILLLVCGTGFGSSGWIISRKI